MIRKFSHLDAKPAKTCAVIRYGAMGDVLQTSSILPQLKEQGYHVTFYLVQNGFQVLFNNPYVDKFIVQDVDVVPNEWLGDFWKSLEKKYDRVINLSESVEKTLLAMPGTTQHNWSQAMRHKYLNHNYLEFAHDMAGIPYKPAVKFYPLGAEREWAESEYEKIGGKVVLWCLGGSAVHKHWPHMDDVVNKITAEGINVVFVGDEMCKVLEQGFEDNPRVHCRSWVWTIRQSMAFAQVCDLVVGSETGMLNAVSFDAVPKIVTLSHSSHENLTRDWVNTSALTPTNTACYPCHRMHYGFDHCNIGYMDENAVGALCQVNISAAQMLEEINYWFELKREIAA
jgi:ADP-heptose:LPS heptosyltransferase